MASLIPASEAQLWANCPGWVLANQMHGRPGTTSTDREEGKAAHEFAAEMIRAARRGQAGPPAIGTPASNGVLLDHNILESARLYADDVVATMRDTGVFAERYLLVEHSLPCDSFGAPQTVIIDCALYDVRGNALYLWEYKHGRTPVAAAENEQLINYYEALYEHFQIGGLKDQTLRVFFRVVQPRSATGGGPIRQWVTDGGYMRGLVNRLKTAADKALSGAGQCESGPHCTRCSVRYECDAALEAGLQLYEASADVSPGGTEPQTVAARYTVVRRAYAQLKSLLSAYEEEVAALLRAGATVPGYQLDTTTGRLDWTEAVEQVAALGDMLGVPLCTLKPITPTQAIAAGIDKDIISEYAKRKPGATKVTPIDHHKLMEVFSHGT